MSETVYLQAQIILLELNVTLLVGEPSPYILIRANLEALIDRKSFYRLVDLGVHHEDWFGVWSSGHFFGIIPSVELV